MCIIKLQKKDIKFSIFQNYLSLGLFKSVITWVRHLGRWLPMGTMLMKVIWGNVTDWFKIKISTILIEPGFIPRRRHIFFISSHFPYSPHTMTLIWAQSLLMGMDPCLKVQVFAFSFHQLNSMNSIIKTGMGHMVLFSAQPCVIDYTWDKTDE